LQPVNPNEKATVAVIAPSQFLQFIQTTNASRFGKPITVGGIRDKSLRKVRAPNFPEIARSSAHPQTSWTASLRQD